MPRRSLQLNIECENDALVGPDMPDELVRILRNIADRIELINWQEEIDNVIFDINGNRVGTVRLDAAPEQETEV